MEEVKTPQEWQEFYDFIILDPDGWREGRMGEAKDFTEPVTKDEFIYRAAVSTIGPITNFPIEEYHKIITSGSSNG